MNDKRKNPRPEGKKCLSDRIILTAVERMINRIIEQEKNRMEKNLYNLISNNVEITDEQRENLAIFLGKGCREKTKKRLLSACKYSLLSVELCGILRRVDLEPDNMWSYCAGQSYSDEIRVVRNVILGGKTMKTRTGAPALKPGEKLLIDKTEGGL